MRTRFSDLVNACCSRCFLPLSVVHLSLWSVSCFLSLFCLRGIFTATKRDRCWYVTGRQRRTPHAVGLRRVSTCSHMCRTHIARASSSPGDKFNVLGSSATSAVGVFGHQFRWLSQIYLLASPRQALAAIPAVRSVWEHRSHVYDAQRAQEAATNSSNTLR